MFNSKRERNLHPSSHQMYNKTLQQFSTLIIQKYVKKMPICSIIAPHVSTIAIAHHNKCVGLENVWSLQHIPQTFCSFFKWGWEGYATYIQLCCIVRNLRYSSGFHQFLPWSPFPQVEVMNHTAQPIKSHSFNQGFISAVPLYTPTSSTDYQKTGSMSTVHSQQIKSRRLNIHFLTNWNFTDIFGHRIGNLCPRENKPADWIYPSAVKSFFLSKRPPPKPNCNPNSKTHNFLVFHVKAIKAKQTFPSPGKKCCEVRWSEELLFAAKVKRQLHKSFPLKTSCGACDCCWKGVRVWASGRVLLHFFQLLFSFCLTYIPIPTLTSM